QAEDGIRDFHVTGVQTCALPIFTTKRGKKNKAQISFESSYGLQTLQKKIDLLDAKEFASLRNDALFDSNPSLGPNQYLSQSEIRSEERRVGKEHIYRWSRQNYRI